MRKHAVFFYYVVPSVIAFALSGVYAIVDGFFIGNSIGDAGLAAINFAWPVTSLLQALGTGIGMGGAVQYSLHLGSEQDRQNSPNSYFHVTILLLFVSSFASAALFIFASKPLLILFGAEGEVLNMGTAYLKVIVLGAAFQIFGTGFVPLIRNLGGSLFAMTAMICGFLTNIVLDWLFVWQLEWSLVGAAAATMTGQGVTMLLALFYLVKNKIGFSLPPLKILKKQAAAIVGVALTPFGLTFSPNIILILMNKFAMIYGGEMAVACYAAVSYITMIILLLLQGVGDGCQPLISRYYGEQKHDYVKSTRQMAYGTALVLAAICMVLLFLVRGSAASLFGASAAVRAEVAATLPYFLAGFIPLAFVKVTTSAFYATEQNRFAYMLVYAEPIFLLILLLILPRLWNLSGIWIAALCSQLLTFAVSFYCIKLSPRQALHSSVPAKSAKA